MLGAFSGLHLERGDGLRVRDGVARMRLYHFCAGKGFIAYSRLVSYERQPDAQSHVSQVLADRRTLPNFVAPSGVPASGGTETCFYYSVGKTKTLHRVMLLQ